MELVVTSGACSKTRVRRNFLIIGDKNVMWGDESKKMGGTWLQVMRIPNIKYTPGKTFDWVIWDTASLSYYVYKEQTCR